MFVHLARIQHKVVFRIFHFNNYGGSYDTTMVLCRIFQALRDGMCCSRKYPYRKFLEGGGPKGCNLRWCWEWLTLGTNGFSRMRLDTCSAVENLWHGGVLFYRPRWPLSFFIGLHLRQSDWKSPTVIMWAGTWRNVQRPTLSLERQVRV